MNIHISEFNKESGFTLVETLVSVFVLTVSISAMLNLGASSFFSVRYSRNDIVGNNLVQEAVEYIRNTRDTAYLTGSVGATAWKTNVLATCTTSDGCMIDPYNRSTQVSQHVLSCPASGCEPLYFFDGGTNGTSFYGYQNSSYNLGFIKSYQTTYYRTVKMKDITDSNGEHQYVVDVTLKWNNALNTKTINQSVVLTDWNI
jgi:Tfp pilus assembly protein PilV